MQAGESALKGTSVEVSVTVRLAGWLCIFVFYAAMVERFQGGILILDSASLYNEDGM